MAIVDLGNEQRVAEQAPQQRRRLRPNWRTSTVPWVVSGAVGLAVVVTAILAYSVRSTDTTTNSQRASLDQTCLEMGGTSQQCSSAVDGGQTIPAQQAPAQQPTQDSGSAPTAG
jgi:hypothetical protein